MLNIKREVKKQVNNVKLHKEAKRCAKMQMALLERIGECYVLHDETAVEENMKLYRYYKGLKDHCLNSITK